MDSAPQAETPANTCDEEGDQAGVSTEDVDRRPGSPTGTRSASQPATETQRKSRGVEEDGQPSESRKVTESLPGYKDLPVVVSAPETETAKEGCDQENDESSEDIQIVSVKMTKKDTTGPSSTERSDERSEHATTPASDPSGSQVVDITDLHSESDEIPWDPNEVKIVDVADEEGITGLPVELVAEITAQDYIPRDHGVYRRICSGQVVLEFLNTVRNSEGRTIIHKFWEYKGDAYRVSRLNLEEYNPFDEMDMRKYWDKW